MDFDHMIFVHSKWKARLREAIQGHEQIDTRVAGMDDQCDLGKWIHGEGKKHAGSAAYQELKTKHAIFHACIPKVVSQARGATPAKAAELLDPVHSDFGRAASDCINAISGLKNSLPKG